MVKMNRRAFLIGLTCVITPTVGSSQSVERSVRHQLQRQGYRNIEVSRTLLGRLKFSATRGQFRREIVLSPSTGVILRDFSARIGSNGVASPNILGGDNDDERGNISGRDDDGRSGSSGGGSNGDDDDNEGGDDDDDNDDDSDDDDDDNDDDGDDDSDDDDGDDDGDDD
ncbi:PepSY domain-containing protein [Litoreibacter roseus]|uniref:PepSY domain-containing protein n=1 Tax=Litoreibacter roseus TaxID=2601869 RepID=A0A6N6JCN8_9RHOB|nr:PepSY domain-containing protein [Litoreibacter roseus]GFE63098.1 hypothetical protein KIN_01720 [Litoreibacter roseus]